MMNLVDYIPPLIGFVAALVALVGKPKWNPQGSGLQKLTAKGYLTGMLAFFALLSSFVIIYFAQVILNGRSGRGSLWRTLPVES